MIGAMSAFVRSRTHKKRKEIIMKKTLKALLLAGLTISMAVACEFGDTSKSSSSNVSSASSLESSQSSLTSSDSTTSSSSNSSSSTSSNTSTSSSSSSSSASSSSSSSSSVAPTPTLVGISINTDNVKKSYNINENLDLTGLVVTAKYSDNSTKAVTDYTTNPANGTKLEVVGEKEITVSYQTFSEKFTVAVTKELTGITLNTDNVKKYYRAGEALDLTGLVVTAYYNQTIQEVVTDYTTNIANGTVIEEDKTIIVSYGRFTAEFNIRGDYGDLQFNEDLFTKEYHYGDTLDFTDINFRVVYEDGFEFTCTDYTITPGTGTVLNKLGEMAINYTAKDMYGREWLGFGTITILPIEETGTHLTLDLSTAAEYTNGVATVNAKGTEGANYTPKFQLTKVSEAQGSMTIVNNRTRLLAGDTIENIDAVDGVTSIRVNGGNGNFKLFAGYTQDKMYEFLSAESESGDRIFNDIPNMNYFKFVGKYDNYPADISSIEFNYTRNNANELMSGHEKPISSLTVNEGCYIKGGKTLYINGDTASVDAKTYTYSGIVYKEALLYVNEHGAGLLIKFVDDIAVIVTDTLDNYSSLTGQYTKVIEASEIKLFINGEEVTPNTEGTRKTMEVGESFTVSATCNAVPSETPVITFTDESCTGEIDPFIGQYFDEGFLNMTDAMSGDECHVIFDVLKVYKENGEYYIDYADHSDGFYPGVNVSKAEAFTTNNGTKLNSYLTDEVTLIIDRTTQTVDIGYYDVENYAFWAECNGKYTFISAVESTATFENGEVKALRDGNFYLTATASNGLAVNYYVKVNEYMFAIITGSTDPVTLKEGDTYQIGLKVDENATYKTLTYSSGDTSILTVTDTGLVTALKEGNTYVDVRSADDSVRLKFTVEKGTPKITVTTYALTDDNYDEHTIVVKEGLSATIDGAYNFTFNNGAYVYDEDNNVSFKIVVSGSKSMLDITDDNMVFFGYNDGPIYLFDIDNYVDLTFVSSEQIEQGGEQGQDGEQGQGQGGEQQQDVVKNYTFVDDDGAEHTLAVTEGKEATLDDAYHFTYTNGHYYYDNDDTCYFDIRHSGADLLDYYGENMAFYMDGLASFYADEGTVDLIEA